MVINLLNRDEGVRATIVEVDFAQDVNRDGQVTALDAPNVIN